MEVRQLLPVLFLIVTLFIESGCGSKSSDPESSIKGYWLLNEETPKGDTYFLFFGDSTISYFMENVGISTYKYELKKDSILFYSNPKAPYRSGNSQYRFTPANELIIKGSQADTFVRLAKETGDSLADYIISTQRGDIEFILPRK